MSTVIKAENIGKKYMISHQSQEKYETLKDLMTNKSKKLVKGIINPSSIINNKVNKEEFWALKDISFEIKQGDRVGIIGRNGAGKSTLLKVLSRIVEPTIGSIGVKGRIASLLEVGTGFHPELTGRENIYLNGAILGMSKQEIKKKFDEIVDFAEVEKFLDTPVKKYSSGMYVRLAFAVAAHLEPEILIVDEVLAVGDAQFQKKCLGKMKQVGDEGRTVLFVSHNMNAIEELCGKGIMLESGKIKNMSNDITDLIRNYFNDDNTNKSTCWVNTDQNKYDNPYFRPMKFFICDENNCSVNTSVSNNSDIYIQIEGYIEEMDSALTIGYAIYNEERKLVYWSYQTDSDEEEWPKLNKGYCKLRSKLPKRLLNEGEYTIELIGGLHFRQWLFEPGKNQPEINLNIMGGLSNSPYWIAKRPGIVAPEISWRLIR